jgi:thiaminase
MALHCTALHCTAPPPPFSCGPRPLGCSVWWKAQNHAGGVVIPFPASIDRHKMAKQVTTQSLLRKYSAQWDAAVRHPFVSACGDGDVYPGDFDMWVAQDYLFVLQFSRMAGRLLGAAPNVHLIDLLLGGLAALQAELQWFRGLASRRNIDLSWAESAQPHATNKRYQEFMEATGQRDFAVQMVAFWAIEKVYNQAWREQEGGKKGGQYEECVARWGSPEFAEYVLQLEAAADNALSGVNEGSELAAEVEQTFLSVAELEVHFWEMCSTRSSTTTSSGTFEIHDTLSS